MSRARSKVASACTRLMGGVHTAYKRDDRRELNGRQILPGDVAGPGGALPPSARGQQARGEVAGEPAGLFPGLP